MVGSAIQNDIFDISTSLGVNWTDYQYAASNGMIGVTAADFTLSMVGTAGGVGGVSGLITQTGADFTSAILGAVTAPPNEAGFIAATGSDFAMVAVGQSLAINARSGTISVTSRDAIATWRGIVDVPHYNAIIANQLPDFTIVATGFLYAAGTRLAAIAPTMDSFSMAAYGTSSFENTEIDSTKGRVTITGDRVGSVGSRHRVGGKRKVRVS
jgi:hypothetical protein